MNTPDTIRNAINANKLIVMCGAKNFATRGNDLNFDIPRAKKGINKVRVELQPNDLFCVTFFNIKPTKFELNKIASVSDVYAENLVSVFEQHTGLLVNLA